MYYRQTELACLTFQFWYLDMAVQNWNLYYHFKMQLPVDTV